MPHLYVNTSDYICCYYTDPAGAEVKQIDKENVGQITGQAAVHLHLCYIYIYTYTRLYTYICAVVSSSGRHLDSEPGRIEKSAGTPVKALHDIASKCRTKVEFRSAMVPSTVLQFQVEVEIKGKKNEGRWFCLGTLLA
ncbi:hypothetical protein POM88_010536 [Heracleum sosnowskyi]|uniref:Uncharacterized protein n=1 Tax=Heracleum sosnowskyi TaxID=360622 RepID=A0AAD8IWN3_9APIA|nr:hypothetical protein POM88_010536 [Heracleum sosnowskyi]